MTREECMNLWPLVNHTEHYNRLLAYAEVRIAHLKSVLETAQVDAVPALQAQIKELRRIQTLKDEVAAGAK